MRRARISPRHDTEMEPPPTVRSPRTREGTISVDEIGSFLRRVGLAESEEELLATVRALDEDESGEVSFDEFVAYVESCQVLSPTSRCCGSHHDRLLLFWAVSRRRWFVSRDETAIVSGDHSVSVRDHGSRSLTTAFVWCERSCFSPQRAFGRPCSSASGPAGDAVSFPFARRTRFLSVMRNVKNMVCSCSSFVRSVPFRSLGQGRADSIVTADAVYERMFATVDGDGSGAISAKEFAAALRKLGQEMTVDDVMEVTKDVDNDGSGQLELVEVRLWHRYLTPGRAVCRHIYISSYLSRSSSCVVAVFHRQTPPPCRGGRRVVCW